MGRLGRWAFVLAPVCLILSFFSSAVLQNGGLMAVFIVLATGLLALALAGKAVQAQGKKGGRDPS